MDGEHEDAAVGGIAADRLRSIIERVERLEEERKALAGDIKDIFTEAKSAGLMLRSSARLSACANRSPRKWKSRKPCWTSTAVLWACKSIRAGATQGRDGF